MHYLSEEQLPGSAWKLHIARWIVNMMCFAYVKTENETANILRT